MPKLDAALAERVAQAGNKPVRTSHPPRPRKSDLTPSMLGGLTGAIGRHLAAIESTARALPEAERERYAGLLARAAELRADWDAETRIA